MTFQSRLSTDLEALRTRMMVLLAIGTMEKDGLCALLGYLMVAATWVFIGLTSMFALGGIQMLLHANSN